jgi:mRNA interferase RelE/StbE
MSYRVLIKRSAFKALQGIDREDRERLVRAIDRLADEPQAGGVLKGEFSGLRRLRVGVYRIVYEVHESVLTVLVVRIAHRREAYR